MKINRRKFLQGIGITAVAVVGGGVYRAVDQGVFASGTGPAYEEWTDWRDEPAEGALRLVQSAILAANPHNTQPWLFQVSENQIELYADTSRHLGTMDPYLREMHIGLGCAIENMMITAAATGFDAEYVLVDGELSPPKATPQIEKVATITLSPGEAQSSLLFDAIPNRHTNRYNYDNARSVDQGKLDEMAALVADDVNVRIFTYGKDAQPFQQIAQATIASTEAIVADHEMAYDSYRWMSLTWDEVQEEKDGPFIDTAGLPGFLRAVIKMLPPMSQKQIDSGWVSGTATSLENTDVLGFIAVSNLYSREGTLQAGRIWQRMHLWATTNGLVMQPINQMPEVVDRDLQLGQESATATLMDEITGEPAWRPTFVFRLGYPLNEVLPSARRSVEEVLV
ncbi:MAG: twin-arginine translocation signal domain-containing protein [Chloroflexota bacterium]